MKKVIYFIFTLLFLLPINSMGQQKGTSKDGLISWSLSDDGTLTITGQGELSCNKLATSNSSYREFMSSVNCIIISPGITEVSWLNGAGTKVTSISLPNTLKKIGPHAFDGYKFLHSMTIPASVTEIAQSAFETDECNGSELEELIVDSRNTKYKSINGILYDYDVKTLICCPSGYKSEANIPNTVETIGEGAFFLCHKLTSIKFPDNLKTIKTHAFACCYKLTDVKLPDNLETIEERAFWCCSELMSITIPNSVTKFDTSAFSGCKKIAKAYVPEDWAIAEDDPIFPKNCTIIHHK